MKEGFLFILFCCLVLTFKSQVYIIGHTKLNQVGIDNCTIIVKQNGVITQSISTRKKTEFDMELDFGKVYQVYIQNPKCVVMYFEVVADKVPKDKYDYTMSHVLEIPLVNKSDPDIDTTVFKDPFYRIVYDGGKKMEEDEPYNIKFVKTMLRKKVKIEDSPVQGVPAMIAGKLFLINSNNPKGTPISLKNKVVYILDKHGNVIQTTRTNRNGAFVLTQIIPSDIYKIKVDSEDPELTANVGLYTSKGGSVMVSTSSAGTYEWNLKPEDVNNLIDNNFTSNIGGKLISSSAKEKKFFSNKNVYLSNSYNTVIKQTKTNLMGTFVFDDIEPNKHYFLGVDKAELKAGEKIDLLGKEDNYIATLDSLIADKNSTPIKSNYNKKFNDLSVSEEEMKMDIKATIFGDNVNHPIGKLKVLLLNDNYQVIDSALTDNLGTFKFKYLPFLKRFYLSAENTDNILDVFKNILIYSSENNLIKIMTHQKGTRFTYNPVAAELSTLRDVEIEDPWMELIDKKEGLKPSEKSNNANKKSIVENILFETNKHNITPSSKEILDKIILVLNTNRDLKITIEAHTDCIGSDVSNLKLSELRAKTVSDYIISAGIDKKRVSSKGFGETKLLNTCKNDMPCSDLEHAQNRRIEFKISGD